MTSALSQLRKKQEDGLKRKFPGIREETPGCYRLKEILSNGKTLTLSIVLPETFPNVAPSIFVEEDITHSYVEMSTRKVIGHPKLNGWGIHNDVGKIVNDILSEFSSTLPVFNSSSQNKASVSNTVNNTNSGSSAPVPPPRNKHNNQSISQPKATHVGFDEESRRILESLVVPELSGLVKDPSACDAFVSSLPKIQQLTKEEQDLSVEVEQLARQNISQEPLLNETREKLVTCTNVYEKNNEELQRLQKTWNEHLVKFSEAAVLETLSTMIIRSEESAEEIAGNFLDEELAFKSFLTKYKKEKANYHSLQKMSKDLESRVYGGSSRRK